MSEETVQVPPLRTNLSDPGSTDQTAKEWYLYWQKSGQRINTLNRMVAQGNHAERPDAADAPDGAIYVEADRSVIYVNEGGEWHYLAGTMWGTLNPDQRPTDLGANDAGFCFRSIDLSDTYAPRTFVWSGSEWIETTQVLYGLHANRPVADEKTPPRTIYVETDRSGVIYQQQANSWHFLAGTMWGTFSPDQRPTDLGANDAGFTFRTTDAPPRSFVWSGTVWIETTPALNNSATVVYGTANPTLTTTATDVPGCSITLSKAGVWLLHGVGYFFCAGAGDNLQFLQAQLSANGVVQPGGISFAGPTGAAATVGQQWVYTAAGAGQIAKLQAFKSGGSGTSQLFGANSSLSATWISP